jgi:hypothetical protein
MSPGPPRRPIGLATNLIGGTMTSASICSTFGTNNHDSPFVITLSDNDDRLPCPRIQLVRPFRSEIILHDRIQPVSSRFLMIS